MSQASAAPRTLDVSELPSVAFGHRTPIWWGVVLLILIELTTLAMFFVAYLYVRGNFYAWPPSERIAALPGTLATCTLVASVVPMLLCKRSAPKKSLETTRKWLVLAALLSVVGAALRAWEIASLPFSWDENAYASIVWGAIGMHSVELGAGVLENVLLMLLLFRGPVEEKHFEDAEVNSIFWAFVAFSWVPFALLLYIDGVVR